MTYCKCDGLNHESIDRALGTSRSVCVKCGNMTPLEFVAKCREYIGTGIAKEMIDLPAALSIIDQLVRERDEARARLKAMQPGCHDVADLYQEQWSETSRKENNR